MAERPILRPQTREWWLARSSPLTRTAVRELDGAKRGKVLLAAAAANRSQDRLIRWALELQTLPHSPYGNYLQGCFVTLREWNAKTAQALAAMIAKAGVVISPTSGHFTSLDHLDPREPIPAAPVNAQVKNVPMARWVDSFKSARYDIGYRPKKQGSLSEVLQLTYADGVVIDIDFQTICDNQEPALGQVFARAYVGIGERLFPLRMSRSSTPKLWREKQAAIQKMIDENADFEFFVSLGLAGVMSNLPMGPVVGPTPPALEPRSPVTMPRRTAPAGKPPVPAESPVAEPPVPVSSRATENTATSKPAPAPPPAQPPRPAASAGQPNALAYVAAPGEVIGQVPRARLPARPFGSTGFGSEMEPHMAGFLRRRFPNSRFRFRTGPGRTGPDVEWVGGDDPGFHIADFKPDTSSGYAKFVAQVRRLWNGGAMAPKQGEFRAAAILYQQDGTVFIGDVATVGRTAAPRAPAPSPPAVGR